MKNQLLKFPNIYIILTAVLGGLPFLIYVLERKCGSLPSADAWYATGANHGPWRMEIEGFLIYYPVIVLLLATLIAFISRGTKEKKISLTIGGIALALVQISILVVQMYFLTWTID